MTSLALLAAHPLVHVNASLNSIAALLLAFGFVMIKLGYITTHKRCMLSAFAVSIAFLVSYLIYHLGFQLQTEFPRQGFWKIVYLTILIPHIVLAIAVPPLAIVTILLGLRSQGELLPKKIAAAEEPARTDYLWQCQKKHHRWAKITFPIWMYVSVTGVVVYLMLYHLFSPGV